MTALFIAAFVFRAALAAAPLPSELEEAHHWAAAKFAGIAEELPHQYGIRVLANNDPVQSNARGGQPMKIGDREYTKGLYCHAVSRVMVYLPGPGNRLEAIAGVDSNEQTSGGRGSVVFSVEKAGGEALWTSDLMREGMAGVPVSVVLNGADVFTLAVGNGGDGIGCDQADWADARVIMEDGSEVWLGDLPQLGVRRAPYTTDPFLFCTPGGHREFLSKWRPERTSSAGRQRTHRYPDRPRNADCTACHRICRFPVVEWTLYFKNGGDKDSCFERYPGNRHPLA